jgi:hypothetical protein
MDFEQPIGDVDAEIGVDPDRKGVESREVSEVSGIKSRGSANLTTI